MADIKRFRLKPVQVKEVNEYEEVSEYNLDPELFKAGYEHGLVSNVLNNFKKSFRYGFRKAKIEQMEAAYKNVRSIR